MSPRKQTLISTELSLYGDNTAREDHAKGFEHMESLAVENPLKSYG